MKLYHGSTMQVKHPNLDKCRDNTDFGKGFYTTTNLEQASKWAILKMNRANAQHAIVSIFEIRDDLLDSTLYNIRHFDGATKNWLEFVANNRRGIETELFDLVLGPVANDSLYATLSLYEQNILTAEAAIEQLKTHKLFNQLSFHSKNAMIELKHLESTIINTENK